MHHSFHHKYILCFSILTACYKARTRSAPDYNHNPVGRVPVLRHAVKIEKHVKLPSKASVYTKYILVDGGGGGGGGAVGVRIQDVLELLAS